MTEVHPSEPMPLRDARELERLPQYLRGVWDRRSYIRYVATSELRRRQITSFLGNLWHLINPALQIGVYYLIFGLVLGIDRGVDNFIAYLSIGVFTYAYTQKSITAGGRALTKYRGLIRLISFPRAVLPITTTLTELLATLPPFLVMFLVAAITGEAPGLRWLLVVPVVLVQTIMNVGLSMIAARAINRIPDLQQVLPFVFRLGFYGSGVIFNVRAYLDDNPWRIAFELNPMYCVIEIYRAIIMEGGSFDGSLVVTLAAWATLSLLIGFTVFRRGEDSYGND